MIIIYLNIIWDFLSSFLIITRQPNFHVTLWKNKTDVDNYAATNLMAYLVFFWGFLRLYGILKDLKDLIIFSYIFEGLIITYETFITKRIKFNEGLFISMICFIIVIYLFII
jgi:hypothetical protein